MKPATEGGSSLPELARIERLARRFRLRVRSSAALPGRGPGRRLGRSGEFDGYRAFEEGDDLRTLDVRVYARLRQRVARVSREDSIVPLTVLIDRSASMVGTDRDRLVRELLLFFACLARSSGDPMRTVVFRNGALERLGAPGESPARLREQLSACAPEGLTDFGRALRGLAPHPAGRGAVVVISDAMGIVDPGRELAPLSRIGLPFWIAPLEKTERDPGFEGPVQLVSREQEPSWSGQITARTRREYRDQLQRYHEAIGRHLRRLGGDLLVVPAESDLSRVVHDIRASRRWLGSA